MVGEAKKEEVLSDFPCFSLSSLKIPFLLFACLKSVLERLNQLLPESLLYFRCLPFDLIFCRGTLQVLIAEHNLFFELQDCFVKVVHNFEFLTYDETTFIILIVMKRASGFPDLSRWNELYGTLD